MEQTYEYAILSLSELETQKNKLDNIVNSNNNISNNISLSGQILSSFNSFYNKLKLKMNYNPCPVPHKHNTSVNKTKIESNLDNILDINKKINKEIEEQNKILKNINTDIINNNFKLEVINNKFKPLLND